MARIVILVAVVVGCLMAQGQVRPVDGEAVGRLCLQIVGFLVTTFLFYVASRGVTLPAFLRPGREVADGRPHG